MSKDKFGFHELTLRTDQTISMGAADKVIRQWLEEKANELNADKVGIDARHILGLTDDGEKCDCGTVHWPEGFDAKKYCAKHQPKQTFEQKQSWCEHIQIYSDDYSIKETGALMGGRNAQFQFKFCPICGTPRPTPKPLVERLAEVNHATWIKSHGDGERWDEVDPEMRSHWIAEAQAALDFLREHKEEL